MEIIPFQFQSNQVRTFTDEFGNIWFVAKDVTLALEYTQYNTNLIKKVPDEWKDMKRIHTLGGIQELAFLLESGLYFFLARSDKPKAIPFQKWIAGEVMPSIRKTGTYSILPLEHPVQTKNNEFNLDFYTQEIEKIFKLVQLVTSQNSKTLYFADNLSKNLNIKSPLELLKIDLSNYYFHLQN